MSKAIVLSDEEFDLIRSLVMDDMLLLSRTSPKSERKLYKHLAYVFDIEDREWFDE